MIVRQKGFGAPDRTDVFNRTPRLVSSPRGIDWYSHGGSSTIGASICCCCCFLDPLDAMSHLIWPFGRMRAQSQWRYFDAFFCFRQNPLELHEQFSTNARRPDLVVHRFAHCLVIFLGGVTNVS